MTAAAASGAPLEMWAGVECSVSRIGDARYDQLERTGHADRLDDIDRLAALGVRTVRYPVLWERTLPDAGREPDWRWPDARLGRLRALGVRPVVGLLHHGSGPRWTTLVDPDFPHHLARYARLVAERYPWVDAYTPVNEPLTTARFSALYGHWYPHARDGAAFARAMLNQCRGIVLAMRAIRDVHPGALLVQTEDLGKTHATAALAYQAAFENERRWLTFDLLTGRVDAAHPMWGWMRWVGIGEDELRRACDECCAPDLLGLNHYLTSERYLDERVEDYPPAVRGGNGRDLYADVEAVRVAGCEPAGPLALFREAWSRYRIPLVVSEVHLGCTREQQMRWLDEIWRGALACRAEGGDVRAVTAWSAFGGCDWPSLMTRADGHYEAGAYDVRATPPRPTALAAMIRELATGAAPAHPVLDAGGWWTGERRFAYGRERYPGAAVSRRRARASAPRCVLITGVGGMLGAAFARICDERGLGHRVFGRADLDIADAAAVRRAVDAAAPWAIVNAAGYVHVDDAERDAEACHRANVVGAAVLADVCARRGVALLTFSSDLVFDGARDAPPYVESDPIAPLGVYGTAKGAAERAVARRCPHALIVRTSACFGPWDARNYVMRALRTLAAGRRWPAAEDVVVSPTYIPDLVNASLDLLIDGERGIWHLANAGAVTWAELARVAAVRAGLDATLVQPCPIEALALAAPRPRYSALASERGALMPSLEDALARHCAACGGDAAMLAPGVPGAEP